MNEISQQPISPLPILYSFRRCPYAMRARLAVAASEVQVELREIILRDKPIEMTSISAKSTVPVLQLLDDTVIDESLDIMFWSLGIKDSLDLLAEPFLEDAKQLIVINDHSFKPCLDKYKYASRFPEMSENEYRKKCEFFLNELEARLSQSRYLCGGKITLADLAIFPFIRQFYGVDRTWFEQSTFGFVRQWLFEQMESELFNSVMLKYPLWKDNKQKFIIFPENNSF